MCIRRAGQKYKIKSGFLLSKVGRFRRLCRKRIFSRTAAVASSGLSVRRLFLYFEENRCVHVRDPLDIVRRCNIKYSRIYLSTMRSYLQAIYVLQGAAEGLRAESISLILLIIVIITSVVRTGAILGFRIDHQNSLPLILYTSPTSLNNPSPCTNCRPVAPMYYYYCSCWGDPFSVPKVRQLT